MPTYTYECSAGHTFEVEQRITEEPLTVCVEPSASGNFARCRAPARRLLPRGTSFELRGKGWAKDGYQ